jgi:hypothetical protein
MSDPSPADLHTRAARVGGWVWCERRAFELLGSWAGTTPEPAVAVLFGEMSRRHGWHAELFADRLPELASVDAEALVAAPGPATLALVDAVASSEAGTSGTARLVAWYRVLLPSMVAQYRASARTLSSVAEPSLVRWLDIVLRDDLEEWARGQQLTAGLLVDESTVRAAAAHQLELDLLAAPTRLLTR